MGREIIAAGLANRTFVERATTGFDEYRATVERYTLEEAERITGVPAELIREVAHAYARADRAEICWTLGITEHHNAVDNVLALINLALLTGHVGRYGSGLNPLRGQNNVQGGGDMGAIPNKYPGFQDVEDEAVRAKFEAAWGVALPPKRGWHLTQMFEAMERGELRTLYVHRREPLPVRGRPAPRAAARSKGLDHLVVQDMFLTAHRADGRRGPARRRGLVRERGHGHEQRAPGAARAQGAGPAGRGARRHRDPVRHRAPAGPRLGPAHGRGRLERAALALADARGHVATSASRSTAGLHWPCPDENHPGEHVPARAALGGAGARTAGALLRGGVRAAGGCSRRAVPDAPHHGPPPRLVQHGRADRRLHVAPAARGDTRPVARRREGLRACAKASGCGCARGGERSRSPVRARPHAPPGPGVHDPALPGRRGHEPADHRRHRSEVGHGRVQGHRDPHREDRGAGAGRRSREA